MDLSARSRGSSLDGEWFDSIASGWTEAVDFLTGLPVKRDLQPQESLLPWNPAPFSNLRQQVAHLAAMASDDFAVAQLGDEVMEGP